MNKTNISIQLHSHIKFWSRQIMQHFFFLFISLSDKQFTFKTQTNDMYNRWKDFFESVNISDQLNILYMEDLFALIDDSRVLKMEIFSIISKGNWIGFLYPSFVEHMIKELDYFNRIIGENPLTNEELINFWNDHNNDYVKLIPHLLDPSEQQLISKIQKLGQYDYFDSEYEMFLYWSINFAEQLNKIQINAQKSLPQSVIHPLLLEHQINEVNYSIEILSHIQKSL